MDYFSWKKARSSCSCGWTGLNSSIRYFELFNELFEFFCPDCREILGHQMYPAMDEIQHAALLGDEEAISMAEGLADS